MPMSTLTTHTWISLWFLLSAPVVLWDASYCFMRPRSFLGGDLHWIWKPYEIYEKVDFVYGPLTYDAGNGFTNAQAFMNLIETGLNVAYLYLAHISQWPPAALIGFAAAIMTLSKTVLYWVQEYFCNYCAIGHNTLQDVVLFWVFPNGLWIVFPALITYQLGKDLIRSLNHVVVKENDPLQPGKKEI